MLVRLKVGVCLLAALSLTSLAHTDDAAGSAFPVITSATNSAAPLSQRVLAYDMDAKYNAKTHSLDATETLTYHNLTGQALDTFPFHLYLNGFQPTSTWIREGKR